MFAGGSVETPRRLRVGENATRRTWLDEEVDKRSRSGSLHFVTVRNEISQADEVAVLEDQHIVYRVKGTTALPSDDSEGTGPLGGREATLTLDANEALLLRFSALTYNSHRIHYDRAWCRREGYHGLVVHGPLQALMMAELARRNRISLLGRRFTYRLTSPMIGPQRFQVVASAEGLSRGAEVLAASGRTTAVSAFQDPG